MNSISDIYRFSSLFKSRICNVNLHLYSFFFYSPRWRFFCRKLKYRENIIHHFIFVFFIYFSTTLPAVRISCMFWYNNFALCKEIITTEAVYLTHVVKGSLKSRFYIKNNNLTAGRWPNIRRNRLLFNNNPPRRNSRKIFSGELIVEPLVIKNRSELYFAP